MYKTWKKRRKVYKKKQKLNRRMNERKAWWKTQRKDGKVEEIFRYEAKKSKIVKIRISIKTISQ